MKKLFFLSVIMFLVVNTFAQPKIYSNEYAEKMREIEAKYKDAIGVDSTSAIFYKDKDTEKFYNIWVLFLSDMSKYFRANNLVLNEKLFFRVFFSNDGKIEYLFYNPLKKDSALLEKKNKKRFEKLLKAFAKSYKIDIELNERFKQCGVGNFQM